MKIIYFLLSIALFSLPSYGKTIAFLDFEDKTKDRKGGERLELIVSSLFPSERFALIPHNEVNKVLTPRIQKELSPITPEIAWTIGELLNCDVICLGSIEEDYIIRFFFIETKQKPSHLADEILDLFLSHFGVNCKIERIISQSELVIGLGKEDMVKIGDRFDCIRDGKKIAECEVVSQQPRRSYLSVLYAKEKISPFDIIRKSAFEINKTNEFLIVNTKPRAFVSWKGNNIGESPMVINDRIKGELAISKEGYKPLKIEIDKATYPDSLICLSLFLATLKREEKKPASLAVSSFPSNCEVFLDGRFIGMTPLFIPNLEEKVYEVVVKKEGFSPYTQKILVNEEKELKVALYSLSLGEKTPMPPEKKAYLSELITLPTSHCLEKKGLEVGLVYPELFNLKAALPGALNAEIVIFGIGCGLKYSIVEWFGIDLYYKLYDMEKKEKQKEKGYFVVGSFNNKFFNIHLGLGQYFKEHSHCQYFVGIDKEIKGIDLVAEYEKDRFRIGAISKRRAFKIKAGLGREKNNTLYNLGIYLTGPPY